MRGYFPKNVSEYTKEQCQEYLEKFPNGLNSESVTKRLELLTSHSKESAQKGGEKDNSGGRVTANKAVEKRTNTTDAKNAEGTKIWEVIVAIIVFIALLILSMLMWDWIKAKLPILAGIMGIVFVIKSLFSKN